MISPAPSMASPSHARLAAFLKAAQRGEVGRAEEIAAGDAGALVHGKDEDGYTALHRSAYNGHVGMMQWLLER